MKISPPRTSSTASPSNIYSTASYVDKSVGGGANVSCSGYGSLLVHSYLSGTTWNLKCKDHLEACPSTISALAKGIKSISQGLVI